MRRSIFDLMNNNEIDIKREYERIHKLFERDVFDNAYLKRPIRSVIDGDYFKEWKNRGRNISIDDLFSSLQIRNGNDLKENSMEKLLLYIEAIVNLISFSIEEIYIEYYYEYKYDYNWDIYKLLKENINSLLEDLNYEIKKLSNGELVIVEKDMLSSSIIETNKNVSDKVIEYRRFILKGKIDEKRDILNLLANEIEGKKRTFKGTTYSNLMDDVQFMLNNLNIRHNNMEGNNKIQYVVNLSKEELEKLYDKTFDMILGIFVIDKYLENKNEIDEIKKHIND